MKKELTPTTTKTFTLTDMLGNNETTFIGDRQKLENKFNHEMDELNDPTENKDFFEWCMDSVEKAPTTTKVELLQDENVKGQMINEAKEYASQSSGSITVNNPDKYKTFRAGQESGFKIGSNERQKLLDSNRELLDALFRIMCLPNTEDIKIPIVEKLLSIARKAHYNAKNLQP